MSHTQTLVVFEIETKFTPGPEMEMGYFETKKHNNTTALVTNQTENRSGISNEHYICAITCGWWAALTQTKWNIVGNAFF